MIQQPSEEEIALLINTGIVASFNAGVTDATAVYAAIAKDLRALFAPILAEKERDAVEAHTDFRKLNTLAEGWKARALAAEAALAAVQGAGQAVLVHRVGDLPTSGYLRDNGTSRQALASLAAAIRAQGETG